MYVSADHKDWDLYLRAVCHGYNTSVCIDSTQYSPFYLMYGREPFCPLDTILPRMTDPAPSTQEYVRQLVHAREVAVQNVTDCQHLIKRKYDQNCTPDPFQPGELVWIFFPEINVGGSPKFFHNWSGPYILREKVSATNFKVVQAHDHKPLKNPIHVNRMKKFHHRSILPPRPDDLQALQNAPVQDVSDLHTHDQRELLQRPQFTAVEPQQQHIQPITNNSGINTPTTATTTEKTRNINTDCIKTEIADPEYEINKILKARYNKKGEIEYLVHWKGFPPSERSYEPLQNLNDAAREYVKTHKIPTTGQRPK